MPVYSEHTVGRVVRGRSFRYPKEASGGRRPWPSFLGSTVAWAGGFTVGVRVSPDQLAALDAFVASEPDNPSRPEAVRRLIERGLRAD